MGSSKELKHIEPKYYGYKGGFASLTQCKSCQAIGLRQDAHPANPCTYCGGSLEEKIGRWVKSTYWIKVLAKGLTGHWELKK